MALIRNVPVAPALNLIDKRRWTLALAAVLVVVSLGTFGAFGLNLGVDFRGGIVIQAETAQETTVAGMRERLAELNLGDTNIQQFGEANTVLIRVQEQAGGQEAQNEAIQRVKEHLRPQVTTYERTEFVGPKVGEELKQAGMMATGLALLAMAAYIWFRFEWQFAVAGLAALLHDVITTLGFFSITQLEFNLGTVAAVLTIAGYSINDTVVVFDRVREVVRKYKRKPMPELLNIGVNSTITRTLLTSGTTLLALIALAVFGGAVIRSFTWALIWGVLIGTFSSIGVAVPMLLQLRLSPSTLVAEDDETARQQAQAAGKSP